MSGQDIIQSKSQKFADKVFPKVQQAACKDNSAKYKTLCKKAGSLVRNSGLMQTLAFFQAKSKRKGEEHHESFYGDLQDELVQLKILPAGTDDLFEYVRRCSVPEYMYLTREVLHLMNWHKRLAETLITEVRDDDCKCA